MNRSARAWRAMATRPPSGMKRSSARVSLTPTRPERSRSRAVSRAMASVTVFSYAPSMLIAPTSLPPWPASMTTSGRPPERGLTPRGWRRGTGISGFTGASVGGATVWGATAGGTTAPAAGRSSDVSGSAAAVAETGAATPGLSPRNISPGSAKSPSPDSTGNGRRPRLIAAAKSVSETRRSARVSPARPLRTETISSGAARSMTSRATPGENIAARNRVTLPAPSAASGAGSTAGKSTTRRYGAPSANPKAAATGASLATVTTPGVIESPISRAAIAGDVATARIRNRKSRRHTPCR